jgi:hypothetical protein
LVNAFEAIDVKQETDLAFPSHPPTPHWLSPDITTTLLRKGLSTTITAKIRNKGPNVAKNARIHFGVHVFSAATPTFYDIGTKVVDIPVDPIGSTDVSIKWTPKDLGHQCFKVEIGYGPDTDYSNNTAQRNIQVTNDPIYVQIKNTMFEDRLRIRLLGTLDPDNTGWDFRLEPAEVFLSADDPPAQILAHLLPPPDVEPGTEQMLHVAAVIDTQSGPYTLGGVTVKSQIGCLGDLDQDGDVDGEDLAGFAAGGSGLTLDVVAEEYGRADCF